jgi:hypothetical protein
MGNVAHESPSAGFQEMLMDFLSISVKVLYHLEGQNERMRKLDLFFP